MQAIEEWIRAGKSPLARRLFSLAKKTRQFEIPVLRIVHAPLYKLHLGLGGLVMNMLRVGYWTPLFRSRLSGTHRRLHIAGAGFPLVTGPVEITMGDGCRLSSAITISGRPTSRPRPRLILGDNVGIGWQTTIAVGSRIQFGDNCRIAGRAFFGGYPGHPVDAQARAEGRPDSDDQVGEIILERDVWLGTGCTVSSGVTIGAGTIVAAGSVVTKSLPAGVIAAGVPARVLRPIETSDNNSTGVVRMLATKG